MSNTTTISTNVLNIMRVAIVLLAICCLLTWYQLSNAQEELSKCQKDEPPIGNVPKADGGLIQDGQITPIGPDLAEFIKKNAYVTIRFTNKDGDVKITNANDGRDIPPCGIAKGTEVPQECGLKGIDLLTVVQNLRFTHTGSVCTTERVGNAFITYHSSGTNAGRRPCHNPH